MTVLAAVVAATAIFLDDIRVVRAAVVILALLVVLPFALLLGRSRDTERTLQTLLTDRSQELEERRGELRELRAELVQVHSVNAELAAELGRLRAQVEGLVAPLPVEPEPVYPSLHLPLVRAAFAEDLPPTVVFEPSHEPAEVPPAVNVDQGSEPPPGRRVLDLTAAELHRLRKASGI